MSWTECRLTSDTDPDRKGPEWTRKGPEQRKSGHGGESRSKAKAYQTQGCLASFREMGLGT